MPQNTPSDHRTVANLQEEVVQLRRRIAELEAGDRPGLQRGDSELASELTVANEELAIFRKFADASNQGFSMADPDGLLTYLNPALCRILGEAPENAVGKHLSRYYPDESNRTGKAEIEPALFQEGHWEGELIMLSAQGKTIPTWHSAFVIRDDSGKPIRLAVVITDITEQREAQAALERERRTLKHMLQASDHERQLIAYDIHDGLAQKLAGSIMHLQIYDHLKQSDPEGAKKAYDEAVSLLQQGHSETRRLISGVRPPILDESGIVAALAHLANEESIKRGTKVEFVNEVEFRRLVPVLENAAYRIAQEALTNALQHSQSDRVRISLHDANGRIRLEVRDWGIGFDPTGVETNRFGLEGIRERSRLLDGECDIHTELDGGTSVVVELPLAELQDE